MTKPNKMASQKYGNVQTVKAGLDSHLQSSSTLNCWQCYLRGENDNGEDIPGQPQQADENCNDGHYLGKLEANIGKGILVLDILPVNTVSVCPPPLDMLTLGNTHHYLRTPSRV